MPLATPGDCRLQHFVAAHPNQRLAYFASSGGTIGYLCAYRFDPVAPAFLPVPGSPFATGGEPADGMAIDPSGTFLYSVASADSGVTGFSIDAATGALTRIAGSPFATAPNPRSIVADPTGRFVYVATRANKTFASTISAYAIDPATGVLTPLPGSPYAAPTTAFALAMDPLGRYVYLTTGVSLHTYAVDPATGALKPTGSSVVGGPSVAVDPAGRFVYVEAQDTAPEALFGVRAYKVEANGVLAAAGGFVPIGQDVIDIAVSRSGRHVYVVDSEEKPDFSGYDYSIAALKRDEATGALTPIAGSPYPVAPVDKLAGLNVLPSQSGWAAGEPMFYPLGVSGGYPPYTWSAAGGSMPPGLGVDVTLGALRGTPTTPGIYDFVAQVTDSRGAAATKAYHFTVGGALSATVPVIEYYHAGLDHYFITWVPDEIAKLDAGTVIKGWTRTGETFNAYATAQPDASPVCRYYIPPNLGDSHFFGRGTAECVATGQKNPSFVQESADFMQMFLPNAGTCPANTAQVYRVFSNRPDANHRYMTSKAIRDQMAAKGWLIEGDGPDSVVMCAPI
ncbi:MAG: beta-propeller fold lactonase family protein [Burkholderiales bacterium]|nr:beta-propeller fold lactonase family protein [Burkholderiales bacterium]